MIKAKICSCPGDECMGNKGCICRRETRLVENDLKTPDYYLGKYKGIKANEVCDDFELSYNLGTAVCYLLRAGKKNKETYLEDVQKAINHLIMEKRRLNMMNEIIKLKESGGSE